ncbi:MAG: hypothetical protein FWD57_02585 [Polyangiaceae bacterium]|nr:hypothetical protein [Polyangiaceae bacterium]
MISAQVIEASPVRALDRATKGGLGTRKLGVVLANSGVGKTACLVQLALDALMRGKTVLHVSSEAPVGHLRSFYDEFFRGIDIGSGVEDSLTVQLDMERRRLLISQPGAALRLDKLREAGSVATGILGREPDVMIVEGFDLDTASELNVQQLRELAWSLGTELWLSVRTHRHDTVTHPLGVPPPVDQFESLIYVMLELVATDGRVSLRVLKAHGDVVENPETLDIDSATMRIVGNAGAVDRSDPSCRLRFMLHSGGAKGAEAAFGEFAEQYGIPETTYSFDGHTTRVRDRGLRLLSEAELHLGDVSLRYVSHHLGRVFPSTPLVRKIIQSIWHQIRPSQQVFAIGQIQEDGTVRGGTGWGTELARRWRKDLYVFDQSRDGWFRWSGTAWERGNPTITSPMFAGIGTAHLEPNGRNAIASLFERSFSPET